MCVKVRHDHVIQAQRSHALGDHSGWSISCLDPSHDHSDSDEWTILNLYSAALMVPAIVPWVGLPYSSDLLFDGPGLPVIKIGGAPAEPRDAERLRSVVPGGNIAG